MKTFNIKMINEPSDHISQETSKEIKEPPCPEKAKIDIQGTNQASSDDEWSDAECMPMLLRKNSYDRELQEELLKTKIMEATEANCVSLFARREILPTSEISDLLPPDFVERDITLALSKSVEKLECGSDSIKQELAEDILVVSKPTTEEFAYNSSEGQEREEKEDEEDSPGRSRKLKKSNEKKDRNRSKKSSKSPKLKRRPKVIEPYHCNCCGKNVIEIKRRIDK